VFRPSVCFYSPTAALAQELRQLPLEEALRKAGQQRMYPSTPWACVLALRATKMGHCFMAADAIEFDVHGRSTTIGNKTACCSEAIFLPLMTIKQRCKANKCF
jgi:hypothetical protein